MGQEKGNFKSRVFGGFNRRDVIAYIEVLAGERNDLALENQALRGKIEALQDRIEALTARPPEENAGDCVTPELPPQDELVLARAEEVLENARGILRDVKRSYGEICGDININIFQADYELKAVSSKLSSLRESLKSAGERLESMDRELEIMPLTDAEAQDAPDL